MQKVMVITGTRKGIGRYLAEHYLSQDWNVIGCSRKNASINHDLYQHHNVDVTVEADAISMVRKVRRAHGKIDALINNAGMAAMNHFLSTPGTTVKNVFRTNLFGTFFFAREAAKVMMKQKEGNIVNFTSVAVPLSLEGEAAYAASKAAVNKLTQILAKELGEFNIRVNAIGPTPIETDLIRTVPKEKINKLLEQQALKRMGMFEDVANVIDFYISEKSRFITGQILYLGGVF